MIRACALMMGGATAVDAAQAVGVTDRTIRNWRDSDEWPRIKEIVQVAMLDEFYGMALNGLRALLAEGDKQAILWFLERAKPEVFGAARSLKVGVRDGASDTIVTIELSPG